MWRRKRTKITMLKCWYHYRRDNDYVAMWKKACLEKRVFRKEHVWKKGDLEKRVFGKEGV